MSTPKGRKRSSTSCVVPPADPIAPALLAEVEQAIAKRDGGDAPLPVAPVGPTAPAAHDGASAPQAPGRVPVGLDPHAKRVLAWGAAGVVGVDAGKGHHALVVRPRGAADSKPLRFATTREGFDAALAYIHRQLPGAAPETILVAIEFAGVYGYTFAHFLDARGYRLVSVLPSMTKKWKEVAHGAPLKTDEKDAASIADLTTQGRFTTFAFLRPEYAALRYLVSGYERVTKQRNAAVTRLRSTLQIAFPEFETVFPKIAKNKTALAILREFPSPASLLAAPKRRVLKVLAAASQGRAGETTYEALRHAASHTLAVPDASDSLAVELRRLMGQIDLYAEQRTMVEQAMVAGLAVLPESAALQTIPGVSAITAAVFLGSVGDPSAYESKRQILKLAGLQLVESSSGKQHGKLHISRRGKGVLRRHAFLYAMRSVRAPIGGIYADTYVRHLSRGKPKMVALIAIARHALALWYAVARSQQPFDPNRLHSTRATTALMVSAPSDGTTDDMPPLGRYHALAIAAASPEYPADEDDDDGDDDDDAEMQSGPGDPAESAADRPAA